MKTFVNITICGLLGLAVVLSSCDSSLLDTSPTGSISGDVVLKDASSAEIAVNGIIRMLYAVDNHEHFGVASMAIMHDMMAEDMILGKEGNGWFSWDALYKIKSLYTRKDERCYNIWNDNYTIIASANYILAAETTMAGDPKAVDYVVGQAYGFRAFAYFALAQTYARTIVGHEKEKCVPIYTGPTVPSTTGQPRSSNEAVYAQIESDLTKAAEKLKGLNKKHVSHLNYATVQGLLARVKMVENKWADAKEAALQAINASKCKILKIEGFRGLNNAKADNVLWGMEIKADQNGGWANFFSHMDTLQYGERAPKQISQTLYAKMNTTDDRRKWWNPHSHFNTFDGAQVKSGYQQDKFHFANPKEGTGDYIFMRVEEMYLTAAEAACRLGDDAEAKKYLMELMKMRDPKYTTDKSGTELGKVSSQEKGSLLEEIITQRRIELWGEFGRMNDLRRLRQGFRRTATDGWTMASYLLKTRPTEDPESYMWVLTIPQSEFDGNVNMKADTDQNPMGDL